MTGRKRRGFTLAEIVISFVLISLLITLVGGVVTSIYLMSSRLEDYSNAYYAAQDETERRLQEIKDLVTEKYRLQNELLNTPAEEITTAMTDRYAEVNDLLADCHSSTVSLFGKSVDLYDFKIDYTSPQDVSLSLCVGVANSEPIERPVPIIDAVTVAPQGAAVTNEIYSPAGKVLRAPADYSTKNSAYYYRTMYQWYLCTGDFHTAALASEEGTELLCGTVYAQYPNDFTILAGETGETLTVRDEWKGHFVACMVTPLSVGGKMGQSVLSNFVYLSALPDLSRGVYRMVLEPSLTSIPFDESGYAPLTTMGSRIGTAALVGTEGARPRISLRGADTASVEEERKACSRYLEFTPEQSARVTGLPASFSGTVFAVARSRDDTAFDFVKSPQSLLGFVHHSYEYGTESVTGWRIVASDFNAYNSDVTVGGGNLDLAELIFVTGATQTEKNSILAYLSEKYSIH